LYSEPEHLVEAWSCYTEDGVSHRGEDNQRRRGAGATKVSPRATGYLISKGSLLHATDVVYFQYASFYTNIIGW